MFWNSKPKSPITKEDEMWLKESYLWFEEVFKKDLTSQEIYLPNDEFFGSSFSGTEDNAMEIFEIVADKLQIGDASIEVYFFDEFHLMEFTDEGVYSSYEEDAKLSNGLYTKLVDGIYQIGIERKLLKEPVKLTATIAHELMHVKLLGEGLLDENDEPLTDLSASFSGFIIFFANSAINKMATWSGNTHSGWQVGGGAGYLHYKIYAFALAYWLFQKNEKDHECLSFLDKEIVGTVRKAIKYLEAERQ